MRVRWGKKRSGRMDKTILGAGCNVYITVDQRSPLWKVELITQPRSPLQPGLIAKVLKGVPKNVLFPKFKAYSFQQQKNGTFSPGQGRTSWAPPRWRSTSSAALGSSHTPYMSR